MRPDAPADFPIGPNGVEHDTSVMIKSLSKIRSSQPFFFDSLVQSLSGLTKHAALAPEGNDIHTLGSLLNFCQGVLSWLCFSIPLFNRMIEGDLKAGVLGAKITGAGGGCIIALPRPRGIKEVVKALDEIGDCASATRFPIGDVKVWKGWPY